MKDDEANLLLLDLLLHGADPVLQICNFRLVLGFQRNNLHTQSIPSGGQHKQHWNFVADLLLEVPDYFSIASQR